MRKICSECGGRVRKINTDVSVYIIPNPNTKNKTNKSERNSKNHNKRQIEKQNYENKRTG